MKASSGGPAGGWKTLGIWVALAFAVLILAWIALIKVANHYAPEPVPLERSEKGEREAPYGGPDAAAEGPRPPRLAHARSETRERFELLEKSSEFRERFDRRWIESLATFVTAPAALAAASINVNQGKDAAR